jgi:hypothetical protein
LRGGDGAALLVALAEIEEALGRFADARVTIAVAIVTLADEAEHGDDDDNLILWCQAQERQAKKPVIGGLGSGLASGQ